MAVCGVRPGAESRALLSLEAPDSRAVASCWPFECRLAPAPESLSAVGSTISSVPVPAFDGHTTSIILPSQDATKDWPGCTPSGTITLKPISPRVYPTGVSIQKGSRNKQALPLTT